MVRNEIPDLSFSSTMDWYHSLRRWWASSRHRVVTPALLRTEGRSTFASDSSTVPRMAEKRAWYVRQVISLGLSGRTEK